MGGVGWGSGTPLPVRRSPVLRCRGSQTNWPARYAAGQARQQSADPCWPGLLLHSCKPPHLHRLQLGQQVALCLGRLQPHIQRRRQPAPMQQLQATRWRLARAACAAAAASGAVGLSLLRCLGDEPNHEGGWEGPGLGAVVACLGGVHGHACGQGATVRPGGRGEADRLYAEALKHRTAHVPSVSVSIGCQRLCVEPSPPRLPPSNSQLPQLTRLLQHLARHRLLQRLRHLGKACRKGGDAVRGSNGTW